MINLIKVLEDTDAQRLIIELDGEGGYHIDFEFDAHGTLFHNANHLTKVFMDGLACKPEEYLTKAIQRSIVTRRDIEASRKRHS